MDSSLQPVIDYYTEKITAFGSTAQGVDWNGPESQQLRFNTLLQILPNEAVSLDDYGCGYGALLDHLRETKTLPIDYLGFDVAASMIDEARKQHPHDADRFQLGTSSTRQADFAIASGIFNVRLDSPEKDWKKYIVSTLDNINSQTTRGFAFNCLTSYSDPPKQRSTLYYGDPCYYFDLCKKRYARNVSLLHDYDLYEFTILVRKTT